MDSTSQGGLKPPVSTVSQTGHQKFIIFNILQAIIASQGAGCVKFQSGGETFYLTSLA